MSLTSIVVAIVSIPFAYLAFLMMAKLNAGGFMKHHETLPLLIGGGGEQVTLKITARHADEWNVWGTPETLAHKMAILDGHCRDLGRDPKEIRRSAVALLFMSEDPAYLERMRAAKLQQASLIGTVEEIRARVAEYERIGVVELIVPDFTLGDMAQKAVTLDRFIKEVAGR